MERTGFRFGWKSRSCSPSHNQISRSTKVFSSNLRNHRQSKSTNPKQRKHIFNNNQRIYSMTKIWPPPQGMDYSNSIRRSTWTRYWTWYIICHLECPQRSKRTRISRESLHFDNNLLIYTMMNKRVLVSIYDTSHVDIPTMYNNPRPKRITKHLTKHFQDYQM